MEGTKSRLSGAPPLKLDTELLITEDILGELLY